MFDPVETAHKSPYFKRNHVGKVVCTLCNIYCNDESTFMRHLSGKTHTQQVENKERRERRRQRLEEEDRLSEAARQREEQERMAQKLASASASSLTSSGITLVTGRFGEPEYRFRTEHHPTRFETKVWLDFLFPLIEDGTRPLHRWLSAREQRVEAPPDNYYVYLLVACEGYTTVAVKFPAEPQRTTRESPMMTSWATSITAVDSTPADAPATDKPAVSGNEEEENKESGGGGGGEPSTANEANGARGAQPAPPVTADATHRGDEEALESAYLASWDPTSKTYHLFFVMSR